MANIHLTHLNKEAIMDSVKDHKEFYDHTNEQSKEGVSLGKVPQQLQPVCQGVQDLV